jgi:hypothetical protein
MATTTLLLLACLIAWMASTKGRSPVGWFLLGVFFNVFALVLLVLLPDLEVEQRRAERLSHREQRLREEFKNHRQRTQVELAEAHARLDVHDRLAAVDTRLAPLTTPAPERLSNSPIPPLPATAQARWYYEYQGQARGPEADSALKLRFLRGELAPATLVWRDGLANWVRAETQGELFA